MRHVLTAAFAALFLAAGCSEDSSNSVAAAPTVRAKSATDIPVGTGFDFFVLALSWSPSYCASYGDRANRQQCDGSKSFRFVVHGLWPQFERGYPSDCPTDRSLTVPRVLSDGMRDIMPATGLIRHQWTKHGTCTGLSQREYFAATRAAYEMISIPQQFLQVDSYRNVDPDSVERAFMASNPNLPGNAIAVTCDRRFLREVRTCLARDLAGFVSCPEVDDDACPKPNAVMPPPQ
jgi:ribonuclease T2